MTIKLTPSGQKFLAAHEGVRLTCYADSRGIPTIGVGHTGLVRGQPQVIGVTKITEQEAEDLLGLDVKDVETGLDKILSARAKVKLAPAQMDALVSFAFNAGLASFSQSGIRNSLEDNLGVADDAAGQLFQWTRAGTDKYALFKRRACEAMLLSRGVYMGPDMKEIH